MDTNEIARAIRKAGISRNEVDSNYEQANLVDGLFAIARAITFLAEEQKAFRRLLKGLWEQPAAERDKT